MKESITDIKLGVIHTEKPQWPDESNYRFMLVGISAQEKERHKQLKDMGFWWDKDMNAWRGKRLSKSACSRAEDIDEVKRIKANYAFPL